MSTIVVKLNCDFIISPMFPKPFNSSPAFHKHLSDCALTKSLPVQMICIHVDQWRAGIVIDNQQATPHHCFSR